MGVDPGGSGVLTLPLKICRRGQSMIWPPKMSHSFIQNYWITASFTTSRMNSWTLSLQWSCLRWRCYHPYFWSAPSRQCPSINAFAAIGLLGLKVSWPKTKLQNVGAGNPPSTIVIDGVPVEGVEEFINLGSKQSSNGYCWMDVLHGTELACSVMNSLYRGYEIVVLSISAPKYTLPSTERSVLL